MGSFVSRYHVSDVPRTDTLGLSHGQEQSPRRANGGLGQRAAWSHPCPLWKEPVLWEKLREASTTFGRSLRSHTKTSGSLTGPVQPLPIPGQTGAWDLLGSKGPAWISPVLPPARPVVPAPVGSPCSVAISTRPHWSGPPCWLVCKSLGREGHLPIAEQGPGWQEN